jgi:hypothetical protein
MRKQWLLLLLFNLAHASGQQNQQLFLMHYLGESNFLNPAVQSECNWFIGIPVFSSVHINYANSAFSVNQLLTPDNSGLVNIDKVVNQLGRRSFIGAEFHTTLLALGYKRGDYYFDFSAMEKVNLPLTISRDIFGLLWNGNHNYEGSEAGLKGTAAYFNYYREYALGISKKTASNIFIGLKGKILFGKLNIATPSTNISLLTDENSYNLTLNGDFQSNLSLPVIIEHPNGSIQSINLQDPLDYRGLLLNRRNWGFAADAGVILPYSKRLTLSASILDLGFIRWRSNQNNITASGNFFYDGFLSDTVTSVTFVDDLINSFSDSMQLEVANASYTTFLPVKTYLGLKYEISPKLNAGGVFSSVIYRTKALTALTASIEYNPFGNVYILASYSLMYRSFKNFGLGFSVGKGPIQFYLISDNVAGLIWPLDTRNINLRFGLNINLGCTQKEEKGINDGGGRYFTSRTCPVYEKDIQRHRRKAGWR